MRNAVGTTWIFSICLTFIIMFTAYIAISINYAKAYKMKNYIVDKIETSEGYKQNFDSDISKYLVNSGYTSKGNCNPDIVTNDNQNYKLVGCVNGEKENPNSCSACIYKLTNYKGKKEINGFERTQYRVETFFAFDLPVIGKLLNFRVGGESDYIYKFNE